MDRFAYQYPEFDSDNNGGVPVLRQARRLATDHTGAIEALASSADGMTCYCASTDGRVSAVWASQGGCRRLLRRQDESAGWTYSLLVWETEHASLVFAGSGTQTTCVVQQVCR